jgi:hypothetical protein
MFNACGPENLSSDFEKLLLYSQSPSIAAVAMMNKTECFISDPKWRPALLGGARVAGPHNQLDGCNTVVYTQIPGLLCDARREISCKGRTSRSTVDRAWALRKQLLELQPEIDQMFRDPSIVEEVPHPDGDDINDTYYAYSNFMTAQSVTLFWRLLIIINRTIMTISSMVPNSGSTSHSQLLASSLAAATSICKTVEYMRAWKPLGVINILVSLPFCYAAFEGNKEMRRWLLGCIDEFSRCFAATKRMIVFKFAEAVELQNEQNLQGATRENFDAFRELVDRIKD